MVVKTLERALSEVRALPEETQEEIGRELLEYLERLRALRADIDEGIRSLEEEGGKPLDIEEIIAEARQRRGKA